MVVDKIVLRKTSDSSEITIDSDNPSGYLPEEVGYN